MNTDILRISYYLILIVFIYELYIIYLLTYLFTWTHWKLAHKLSIHQLRNGVVHMHQPVISTHEIPVAEQLDTPPRRRKHYSFISSDIVGQIT